MKAVLFVVGVVILLTTSLLVFTEYAHPEGVSVEVQQAYFISGNYSLAMDPETKRWVRNGWNFSIAPRSGVIDFTGWSLHSTVSGKRYVFDTVTPLGSTGTVNIVIDANQEGALIVETARTRNSYLAEGNEYHVDLGNEAGWNRASDTIELIRPDGTVADTYSYE